MITKRNATTISLTIATMLALMKIIVGFFTGSLMVITSAVDSFLDMASSLVNFYAIRRAEEPPDEEHPYGHGKFEPLATLFQSIFILMSGAFIMYRAVIMIMEDDKVRNLDAGLYVMLFSIVATAFVVGMLRIVGKREKSTILKAEALHYEMDLFSNIGIIVALVIIHFTGLDIIDAIISILIAIYIIKSSVELMMSVSGELLDKEIEPEEKEKLMDILNGLDKYVFDFHNVRTRKAGGKLFIDMHVMMDADSTLTDVHSFIHEIERHIKNEFDNADVMVHAEPCNEEWCNNCDKKCKMMLANMIEDIKKRG